MFSPGSFQLTNYEIGALVGIGFGVTGGAGVGVGGNGGVVGHGLNGAY